MTPDIGTNMPSMLNSKLGACHLETEINSY